MTKLPETYLDMMKRLLKEEYEDYDLIDGFFQFFDGRCHNGGVNGRRARLRVSQGERAEHIRICFHDVDAASAVCVDVNEAGKQIAASHINYGVGEEQIFRNKSAGKAERAVFKAALFRVVNIGIFKFDIHRVASVS